MSLDINKLQSPCFIINKMVLDENINDILVNCDKIANDVIISYSLKTNSDPFLVRHLYKKGLYIEVVSADEYKLALSLGIKKQKIIYNGVIKNEKTFLTAVNNNSIVNIDSYVEFEWLLKNNVKNKKIGLRINLPIDDELSNYFEFPKTGSRFGFSYCDNKLQSYIKKLKEKNIVVNGIHIHCNTFDRNPIVYKKIIDYIAKLVNENNFDIEYLDIGGGYMGGKEYSFNRYSVVIDDTIKKYKCFDNVKLVIEPGAAIVATAITYFCRVIDKKSVNNTTFITIDGSVVHINPTFSRKKYKYSSDCNSVCDNKDIIICGFTCMERDRIIFDKKLDLRIGNYLMFENMGAYVMPFVSSFICNYPSVYLYDGNNIKMLSKNERR